MPRESVEEETEDVDVNRQPRSGSEAEFHNPRSVNCVSTHGGAVMLKSSSKFAVLVLVIGLILTACSKSPAPTEAPTQQLNTVKSNVEAMADQPEVGVQNAPVAATLAAPESEPVVQAPVIKNIPGTSEVSEIKSAYNGQTVTAFRWVLKPGAVTGTAILTINGVEATIEDVFVVMSNFDTEREEIVGIGSFAEDGTITVTGNVTGVLEVVDDGGEGVILNLKTQ